MSAEASPRPLTSGRCKHHALREAIPVGGRARLRASASIVSFADAGFQVGLRHRIVRSFCETVRWVASTIRASGQSRGDKVTVDGRDVARLDDTCRVRLRHDMMDVVS